MSQDLSALRANMFETLKGIRSGDIPRDMAVSLSEVHKNLIDTAKVEVDYLRAIGGSESSFIDTAAGENNLPAGIVGITRHRIGG